MSHIKQQDLGAIVSRTSEKFVPQVGVWCVGGYNTVIIY